jgi:elongation factor G
MADDIHAQAPQVAYRETITRQVTVDYTHKTQSGGSGQFARVRIVVEPSPPASGFIFENKAVGGSVLEQQVPGVEKGLESALGAGAVAGFPVVGVKVTLIDGAYHDVDSPAIAFEIAARAALREALQKGDPVLLEPIMKVEVVTPGDFAGPVIGDLNSRRGQIQGQGMRGDATVIHAMVRLVDMYGYVNALRSISQGRATFTMQFDHYARVALPDGDPPFRPAMAMRA